MADYIDREAAENLFYAVDPENDGSDGGTIILLPGTYNSAEIGAMLESLPAADVEPVRRWIPCRKALPNTRERVLATDGVFVGEMCINKRGQWQRYNIANYETLMSLDILA